MRNQHIQFELLWLKSKNTESECFKKFTILLFQNNLLPSGEKFLVAKSLVIDSVDRHEAGTYNCEAKNGVGSKTATATIKLQVLCK